MPKIVKQNLTFSSLKGWEKKLPKYGAHWCIFMCIRDLHGNGKLTHPHPLLHQLYPSPSDMVSVLIRPAAFHFHPHPLQQDFLSIPTHPPILNSPELITKHFWQLQYNAKQCGLNGYCNTK